MSISRNKVGGTVSILFGAWNIYVAWRALTGTPLPLMFAVPVLDFLIALIGLDSEKSANEIYAASSALIGSLFIFVGVAFCQMPSKTTMKPPQP